MEQGPDELSERTMEGVDASGEGSDGVPAGSEAEHHERSGEPEAVDEGSEESFPASDPPSGTNPAV